MSEPKVRIFVSSPSDLEHERAIVRDLIESLGQEYRPYFALQAILWEEEALTAAQSFQAGLLRPSECEIVLVMLWTRLGTPLAEDPYGGMTGTEWEFIDAVQASARTGSPEVLVYRKTAPRLVDVTDAEATREALADRHRLEGFFRTHFFNPDGSFSRAFRQFGSDRAFRELAETQLRKLLNRRISAERRLASGTGDWQGSPFRAGVPFEISDDRVFTGRETESRDLIARLEALQGPGRGWLLVSGPSGVGKSSLIRAGLLPRLSRPFLIAGVASCRWGLVELDGADPIAALATALVQPGMLGGPLEAFGLDSDRLARLLVNEPDVAADQIQAALLRLAEDPAIAIDTSNGRLQLAIVVDPLDRLFAGSEPVPPASRRIIAALALLAARDGIWVIATLRSDRLERLAEIPELGDALDERSWFRLEPPPPARIRQVIEIPARVAGIEYEGTAGGRGRGLVELLEAEASLLEHWPLVLQPALDAIDRRARERAPTAGMRLLTVEDYRALGGLSGALLAHVEGLWADLDPVLRAALPILCRALIALEGGGGTVPSSRSADLGTLAANPAAARLIEILIDARLLVADGVADPASRTDCSQAPPGFMDELRRVLIQTGEEWRERLRSARPGGLEPLIAEAPSGLPGPTLPADTSATDGDLQTPDRWADWRPRVSFVHPALFRQWRPIRDWLAVADNRRDLILRYQISRQARLWKRTDCNREYLLGEAGYAAARRFADAYGDELEPLERGFIEASYRQLLFQRSRNRWARILGLTLAALLILATSTAFWAWNASREANLNLQRSLLKAADLAIRQGNPPEAIRLALDAGPYLPEAAADTLSRAFTTNRLIAMVQLGTAPGDAPLPPAFRDDGERLVTQSTAAGAVLWALRGRRFEIESPLSGPEIPIHSVRFVGAPKQKEIVGIGEAGVWRLPAPTGQPPDWSCGSGPDSPIALDPGGRFLAIAHGAPDDRYAICLLALDRPGAPLWDRSLHAGEVRSIDFAPDGELLVTASRDGSARIVETSTGTERRVLPSTGSLGRPANGARFDPAGRRIAVASADERVRIYDLEGQELAELGVVQRDGRGIRIHRSAVREAVFSPGGQYLIAGDDSGQVVRWDPGTGQAEILGQHRLSVEHLRVAPGIDAEDREPLVLSASLDNTARLWGLLSGREIAIFSHDAAVTDARFSRDGRRILSYSGPGGSARLWSVRPTETLAFHLPSADHVWHLAMADAPPSLALGREEPRPILLATAAFDGRVEVWLHDRRNDELPPTRIWTLSGHQGRVRRLEFAPSAASLASAGHDGTAWVWDLTTGGGCRLPVTVDGSACRPDGGRGCPNVHQARFAPDARWLLTTSSDTETPIRFWDPVACAPLEPAPEWASGGSGVPAAAVTEDPGGATLIAVGDDDGRVRVARMDKQNRLAQLCDGHWQTNKVTDIAFAPDGRWLAASSEDGSAVLVPVREWGCGSPHRLEPGAGILYSVAFAPDAGAVVTAALDGRAQVWALDGTLLAELVGHRDRIYTARFSPDGRWILTASRDGAVRIWRRPTTARTEPSDSFLILAGEAGGVAFADFSPDGNHIGAAYWDNATLLWRLWTEDSTPRRRLESIWGRDRARLALIREAIRFRDDNRLDGPREAP